MKKLLLALILVLALFGCGGTKEEGPTFDKTFECTTAGVKMEFKKDGTAIFYSLTSDYEATATYTKDGKTAFRVTFDNGSGGGYVKIEGDNAGIVDDSSKTADEVDAIVMADVDYACTIVK